MTEAIEEAIREGLQEALGLDLMLFRLRNGRQLREYDLLLVNNDDLGRWIDGERNREVGDCFIATKTVAPRNEIWR
jgi:hypothetical protein